MELGTGRSHRPRHSCAAVLGRLPSVFSLIIIFTLLAAHLTPGAIVTAQTAKVKCVGSTTAGTDCLLADAITAANGDATAGSCEAGSGIDDQQQHLLQQRGSRGRGSDSNVHSRRIGPASCHRRQ